MQLTFSAEKLDNAQKLLSHIKGAFPKAVSSTLNRVIEGVRTDLVSETKERYYAKPSDIRKTFKLKKTNKADLQAVLTSRGLRKNLREYFITPKSPKKGMKGIQAAVKRDGVKSISKAFLIRRGGNYKAYLRKGRGRFAVEPITSPSIPQILKNPEIVKIIEKKAAERFNKRIDHEVARVLGIS